MSNEEVEFGADPDLPEADDQYEPEVLGQEDVGPVININQKQNLQYFSLRDIENEFQQEVPQVIAGGEKAEVPVDFERINE